MKREELELKRATKRGEVEAARIELANLELEREQAVIRAPIDGVVTTGDVKVGDVLEPGKPVVEIAEQEGFRLRGARSRARRSATCGSGCRCGSSWTPTTTSSTAPWTARSASSPRTRRRRRDERTVDLYREDRAGQGRGGPRGVRGRVKLGMAGQAEIVTGRESLLVAPGEADPPDDQPRLRPAHVLDAAAGLRVKMSGEARPRAGRPAPG